jgi:hypothetical protein
MGQRRIVTTHEVFVQKAYPNGHGGAPAHHLLEVETIIDDANAI